MILDPPLIRHDNVSKVTDSTDRHSYGVIEGEAFFTDIKIKAIDFEGTGVTCSRTVLLSGEVDEHFLRHGLDGQVKLSCEAILCCLNKLL